MTYSPETIPAPRGCPMTRFALTNASTCEIWTDLTATDLRWRFDVPSVVVSFLEHQVVGHKVAKGHITIEVVR